MSCTDHVARILRLSTEILEEASRERASCDHDECLILDGIVRDYSLQIRREARRCELGLKLDQEMENAWPT